MVVLPLVPVMPTTRMWSLGRPASSFAARATKRCADVQRAAPPAPDRSRDRADRRPPAPRWRPRRAHASATNSEATGPRARQRDEQRARPDDASPPAPPRPGHACTLARARFSPATPRAAPRASPWPTRRRAAARRVLGGWSTWLASCIMPPAQPDQDAVAPLAQPRPPAEPSVLVAPGAASPPVILRDHEALPRALRDGCRNAAPRAAARSASCHQDGVSRPGPEAGCAARRRPARRHPLRVALARR